MKTETILHGLLIAVLAVSALFIAPVREAILVNISMEIVYGVITIALLGLMLWSDFHSDRSSDSGNA